MTLTQEQLNAILKSVGKITGGEENAIKISIGEKAPKIRLPWAMQHYILLVCSMSIYFHQICYTLICHFVVRVMPALMMA